VKSLAEFERGVDVALPTAQRLSILRHAPGRRPIRMTPLLRTVAARKLALFLALGCGCAGVDQLEQAPPAADAEVAVADGEGQNDGAAVRADSRTEEAAGETVAGVEVDAQEALDAADAVTDTPEPVDATAAVDAMPVTEITAGEVLTDADVPDVPETAAGSCTLPSQCPAAAPLCIAGVCRIVAPCQQDSDCKSVAGVCDAAVGHCVACAAENQCGPGQPCKASTCLPKPKACQSAKDCAAVGAVCHPDSKVCVDCINAADCGAGFGCVQTVCVHEALVPACEAPAVSCQGSVRLKCGANGKWLADVDCAVQKQLCDAGACYTPCKTAATKCQGSLVLECNAAAKWTALKDCAVEKKTCKGGACK
jgi:hypothetical protein